MSLCAAVDVATDGTLGLIGEGRIRITESDILRNEDDGDRLGDLTLDLLDRRAVSRAAEREIAAACTISGEISVMILTLVRLLAVVSGDLPTVVEDEGELARHEGSVLRTRLFRRALRSTVMALDVDLSTFCIDVELRTRTGLDVFLIASTGVGVLRR